MTTTEKQLRFDKLEELRVTALMDIERLQSKLDVETNEKKKAQLDVSIDWSWSIISDAMDAQRNL